ncbi:MAG: hypothetical protein M3R40_02685 [Pseudomonadota bacterium]|nr:hypothetical protein [Pseudomonadota bacterium]
MAVVSCIRLLLSVTLYLRTLRDRTCVKTGRAIDAVVMGRPVRFDDDDAERDREAQRTLEFPASRVVVGDRFGSVVSYLGIDAARRFACRGRREDARWRRPD